jgi:hypothetical protein
MIRASFHSGVFSQSGRRCGYLIIWTYYQCGKAVRYQRIGNRLKEEYGCIMEILGCKRGFIVGRSCCRGSLWTDESNSGICNGEHANMTLKNLCKIQIDLVWKSWSHW